jgi:nucleoside-diphosphate-sugar epimerase
MKRAFLTGEKGFIAKNLIRVAGDTGRIRFINKAISSSNIFCNNEKGEINFANPIGVSVLREELRKLDCNVIIHNGAAVGTDVCGIHPKAAILNNVYGTYNIALLAKELNIPVVYIGTTVVYDTQKVQDDWIDETSPIFPRTLYATTKYEGELIIRAYCQESKYCILRPLFCYGGEGDMNSLIAKSIFNVISGRKKPFKIFLNKTKIKDYMHVNDFCEAITIAATSDYIMKFNTDFNIAANDPIETSEIVKQIESANIDTSYIQWVPETDYLGNHRVNSSKFKIATAGAGRWEPKISLKDGIRMAVDDIRRNSALDYNPFKHLDNIEKNNINIETHYNFKG